MPVIYQRLAPSVVLVRTSHGLGHRRHRHRTGTHLHRESRRRQRQDDLVTFADGTTAHRHGRDLRPEPDIATLTPAKLPEVVVSATLGGAVAVGSAGRRYRQSAGPDRQRSAGVVSGLNRTSYTADSTATGLIQFDAAVDPGSSGGPLLDAEGSVVGIVVSIADPGKDGAWAGIGFAVPIGAALAAEDGTGPEAPHI